MTTVNTTPTPAAAPTGTSPTISQQQRIENALSLALWHIRQDEQPGNIHRATCRAVRAATLLKQACTEAVQLPADLLAAIQGRA